MKKSMKIFSILLVSLITLISVVCVTAFATEAEETLDITLKKNIAVTDKIQAMYAVKADENITVDNTTLTVYDKDPSAEGAAIVWEGKGVSENLVQFGGESYIVFYTNRVALFEMAEIFYIQLESNGLKSAVETYSVAEYLFDRLYKDGFVNKTEDNGKDYSRKMFYEDLVRTGKSSFDVLTHTVEKSIADLAYVYVDDATLADGSVTAVVNKNDSVTLGTLPSGKSWKITNYTNGVVTSTETKDSTISLSGCNVVTLVSDLGKGAYYSNSAYSANAKYNYDTDMTLDRTNLIHPSTNGTTSFEAKNGVLTQPEGKMLSLVNSGNKSGTTYVFETDILIEARVDNESSTDYQMAWLGLSGAGTKKESMFLALQLKATVEDGEVTGAYLVNHNNNKTKLTDIEIGTWQNLRIEYTPRVEGQATTYTIYLNGTQVYTGLTAGWGSSKTLSDTSFESFILQLRTGYAAAATITYDNTFMSAIGE